MAWRVIEAFDLGQRPAERTTSPSSGDSPLVLRARVERVIDGDTLILDGVRFRFCGIDAPEMSTPAGPPAREALIALTSGRTVECRQVGGGTPCDGRSAPTNGNRIVAQCFADGRDLSAQMVCAGHARDVRRFSDGYYAP